MSRTLMPISTLPADATNDTVQLYRNARSSYGMPVAVGGVEECIPCRDFQMTIQDAQYWAPRSRLIPEFSPYD